MPLYLFFHRAFDPTKCQKFFDVRAFIRVGTKYEIDHLRRDAIDVLSRAYPYNLDMWYDNFGCGMDDNPIDDVDDHFKDTMELLWELNLDFLLPVVYLRMCEALSLENIVVAGCCTEDLRRIVSGRGCIHANWSDKLVELLKQSCPCLVPSCVEARIYLASYVSSDLPSYDISNIFESELAFINMDGFHDLCSHCKIACCKLDFERVRQDLWKDVPKYFGFDNWEKLKGRLDAGEILHLTFIFVADFCAHFVPIALQ